MKMIEAMTPLGNDVDFDIKVNGINFAVKYRSQNLYPEHFEFTTEKPTTFSETGYKSLWYWLEQIKENIDPDNQSVEAVTRQILEDFNPKIVDAEEEQLHLF